MLKILKILLICFGVFLAGLLCAAAALWLMFPPAKVRALAEQAIHEKMNREAKIGTAHLGVSGLTLDTLELSESPNFKSGAFLTAEGVRLDWSLRKLWEGFNLHHLFPSQLDGKLSIAHLHNSFYEARNLTLAWDLHDLDPTLQKLNGWAKLRQGPGVIENIERLAASGPGAKVALMPLLVLQNLEKLGIVNLGLPDLSRWPVDGIEGDYQFRNGIMKIEKFQVNSPQMSMETHGMVELPTGSLALEVGFHSPQRSLMGQMDLKMHVSGTLSHPVTNLDSLKKKAFKATITHLIESPDSTAQDINKALGKIFH